ncbi:MAG: hypothetical protein WKG32_20150 [Gemmatimonadaceae bacterium]
MDARLAGRRRAGRQVDAHHGHRFLAREALILHLHRGAVCAGRRMGERSAPEHAGERRRYEGRHDEPPHALHAPVPLLEAQVLLDLDPPDTLERCHSRLR